MPFHRVLIALDESALAAHACDVGAGLARALHAQTALVYVVDRTLAYAPDGGVPLADMLAALKREGQAFLASAAQRLGDPPPWQFLKEGKPADEVIGAAREWQADLIVIGTHGRSGVSRLMLGSTAESVLRHATCPVMVVKSPAAAA
jgi:nucleotide-binding universal stress UspA family protein